MAARACQDGLSSLVPATVEVRTRRKRAISSQRIDGLAALVLRSQGTLAIALAHDELLHTLGRSPVLCTALLLAVLHIHLPPAALREYPLRSAAREHEINTVKTAHDPLILR